MSSQGSSSANASSTSIILRYKLKTKKLGLRSKLSSDDLSYLIASHFDIKGKIIGLKDSADNFYQIQQFCTNNSLKRDEVYHVIVDASEIPNASISSSQSSSKNQPSQPPQHHGHHHHASNSANRNSSSANNNSSSAAFSQDHSLAHQKSGTPSTGNQSRLRAKSSSQDTNLANLSRLVTIVNKFKVWEDNFQDPLDDRTSVIALVPESDSFDHSSHQHHHSQSHHHHHHHHHQQNQAPLQADWVGVMNRIVENYGDRADYFCCVVREKDEIAGLRVFPSIVVYSAGQKVMEISLQNQAKTIIRLLERFLNSASVSFSASSQRGGAVADFHNTHTSPANTLNKHGGSHQQSHNHPLAMLLMEQSVQQTEFDTGDIITIPANIPDQRELLTHLEAMHAANQISLIEFLFFKCKLLEQFDLFLRSFFETYNEFDKESFKDFVIFQAHSQQISERLGASDAALRSDSHNPRHGRPQTSANAQQGESGRHHHHHHHHSNTPTRSHQQQPKNTFESDSKPTFSQEQLIKAVIELETYSLLEMPILTQIKRLILAENTEILSIIEDYLSSNTNDLNSLSSKLRNTIMQARDDHADRPTSPWPKREKIIQMFNAIVAKSMLSQREEEILRMLIAKNDQQLMGTFSDGRVQDELVKSLKSIASQYISRNANNSTNNSTAVPAAPATTTGQSVAPNSAAAAVDPKINNFFTQSQREQGPVGSSAAAASGALDSGVHQKQLEFMTHADLQKKKLDFAAGHQSQQQDASQSENVQNASNNLVDAYFDIVGSDAKQQKRSLAYQNANLQQSSSSSAQFATIQRQLLSASPPQQTSAPLSNNTNFNDQRRTAAPTSQPFFHQETNSNHNNEDSPLHTIQLNPIQAIQTNEPNQLSQQQQPQLLGISQLQSQDDLNAFNSNPGVSSKGSHIKESSGFSAPSRANKNTNSNNNNNNPDFATQPSQSNRFDQSEQDPLDQQNLVLGEPQQQHQQLNGDDQDSECSALSPHDLMDEYIDQFTPEEYGMAIHLVEQQNEDILLLFQEILQLNSNVKTSQIVMPIKLIVSNRFKDLMRREFRPEELAFIEASKDKVTTSIFAVHQQFRVECDFDLFVRNLKIVLSKEATAQATSTNRKFSLEDSDEDASSNHQFINAFLGKNSSDDINEEGNPISPIDNSLQLQQQNQYNQPSFSNQQTYYDSGISPSSVRGAAGAFLGLPNVLPQQQQQGSQQSHFLNEPKILFTNSIAVSEKDINQPTGSMVRSTDAAESNIRKRLKTESLAVETNARFSPRNKKPSTAQRQGSPGKEFDSVNGGSSSTNGVTLIVPDGMKSSARDGSLASFGLINLQKLQQIDVCVEDAGQNVQDNDLNEILSSEINEFYCSFVYNENDRIFDEIINLTSNSVNPLSKKVLEKFSILYQINDLEVIDIVEEYKRDKNLQRTKAALIQIIGMKKLSTYSQINSVNNKIGKFNLFKKLLRQIENHYRSELIDFQVQQYLFLHDDVVTLAAFESYLVNKNWREFVENLVLIEKMSLIKFSLNKTEISKLNMAVLQQLQIIYEYGRYLRNEQKKDLETAIKEGSNQILDIAAKYDSEEIDQQTFINQIIRFSDDISKSLRKEEYIWLQKFSCPSIEEREDLKQIVESFRQELKEREIQNLDVFFQMISQANKNIMSVLALYEYNKDSEDFFENLAMLYHNEISHDMKRLIRDFAKQRKWNADEIALLERKVDEDDPALVSAYYHYKKNETDKEELLELRETFEIYLSLVNTN